MTRPVPMTLSPSVAERLGVTVRAAGPGADPAILLGLALRRNPRRAQLLVSRVLGKHVPTDPRLVRAAGLLLGGLVADALAGREPRALPVELLHGAVRGEPGAVVALVAAVPPPQAHDALVLGYAETATALGHGVAEALTPPTHAARDVPARDRAGGGGADYLHSTRRAVQGFDTAGGFAEEHSHAAEHLLLPADPALLRGDRPLVLVDDELSTGRTVLNTVTALHATAPRERYVVATLVDARPDDSLAAGVAALGARLDVVSLCRAAVDVPVDVLARAAAIRAALPPASHEAPTAAGGPAAGGPAAGGAAAGGPAAGGAAAGDTAASAGAARRVRLVDHGWPPGLPAGGRHGFRPADHRALDAALPALARGLGLRPGERTLVLGTEELMAVPLRLAHTLADAGCVVRFSTTTRSPAVVLDEPGYALRTGITFPAHDEPADGPGPRFAYNLGGPGSWDHVVVVVDPPADTPALPGGLLAALAPLTRRTTLVITP